MVKSLLLFSFFFVFSFNSVAFANNGEEDRERILRKELIRSARTLLGINYKMGGTTKSGFDCSGFTKFVYDACGEVIPRTSREQSKDGKITRLDELKSGDLVFFEGKGGEVNHVAMVLRRSKNNLVVIHSTSSGGVMIDDIMRSNYWKGRLKYGVNLINN